MTLHGPSSPPLRILLVEDSPADVRLFQVALSEAPFPHELIVVEDGEAALQFVFQEGQYTDAPRPDLILLDLNLPKRSGHEVVERLKADPERHAIPVIIYSSSPAEADVKRAYQAYANCYVKKPLDLDDMYDVMQVLETFWFRVVSLPRAT